MTSLIKVLHEHAIDTSQLESYIVGDSLTFYLLPNTAPEPLELWRQLRALVDQTQHWPIMMLDDTLLSDLPEFVDALYINDLIEQTQHFDITAWLAHQQREREQRDDEFCIALRRGLPSVKPWPNHRFEMLHNARTRQDHSSLIVLIPTIHGWQAPLYLYFGGFNHCPDPLYHASMLKYWAKHYNVEPFCIDGDSLEMHVPAPPSEVSKAWKLAIEQFAYCEDMDHFYDLESLTAALLKSTVWSFWWD